MFIWFKESASIKQKLSIAFFLQVALTTYLLVILYLVGAQQLSVNIALAIGGSLVLVSTIIGLAVRRWIAAACISATARMEALAAGDIASPIPFTLRRDCFGRMARAMRSIVEAAA